LVSPNFSYLNNWCKEQKIEIPSKEELINLPPVLEQYSRAVKEINQGLNGPEKILRFRLVADEWMPSTGELSPTLKLKRNVISSKYSDLIKSIYVKQVV
jgi:long-chain acyl-CoA synthetase